MALSINIEEILNFPGPMPPVDKLMLQQRRIVTREYRNRKIGSFLKELNLIEGRGTGLPIIYDSLEKNGSPPPQFITDDDRSFFLCIIPIHPMVNTNSKTLSQERANEYSIERAKDTPLLFNTLHEVNQYLCLPENPIGAEVAKALSDFLSGIAIQVLKLCLTPKSKDEIFKAIKLYNNSKNFSHHLKPIIDIGWIGLTVPDKPTSKNQKYTISKIGKQILEIIQTENL